MHDYKTGLPKGHTGTMLYLAERETEDRDAESLTENKGPAQHGDDQIRTSELKDGLTEDLNALAKSRGKDKDKAKGYGKCRYCGEWGHPRRECPEWLKQQGKGDVSALKGGGKKGYKGKGKQGKGKGYGGGKGKGYQYRSPGKGVGKGLNYWGGDDYAEAWGGADWGNDYHSNDYDYDYGYGSWET